MSTNCSAACVSKDHKTFGECMRSKGVQLGDVRGAGTSAALDLRFNSYDSARRQGIQPATTRLRDVNKAVSISDKYGRAFDANPR